MDKAKLAALRAPYIPAGAIKITSKKSPTVAYLFTLAGKPYIKGFIGNAVKPTAYYWFKDEGARAKYIAKWFAGADEAYAYKEGRKAESKAKLAAPQTVLKVGDILSSMWGYDQTNIDYYEVVALVGKRGVVIREIAAESLESGYMTGESVPVPGKYVGEPMKKMVNEYGSVRITSFSSASKMEPISEVAGVKVYKAKSWTAYA